MEISSSSNVVTITGNIKSISDFQEIKSTLDMVASSNDTIVINLKDSISITSSVIGYFNKLILKDKISLSLKVGNAQLIDLINDLNLTKIFNATKA